MQKQKQTWWLQTTAVSCSQLLIAHTYNSGFRMIPITYNLKLIRFAVYTCFWNVWHHCQARFMQTNTGIVYETMDPWGLVFELRSFQRHKCQVSAELCSFQHQTLPSTAQTWCCSACSVMQQDLCANPIALLHYTWSVNTYLWKWLLCTCLAMQWRCHYQCALPGNQIPNIKTSYRTDQHLWEWSKFACECRKGNFENLKQCMKGHLFHNNEEVQKALHDWLQMQKPYFYRNNF